MGKEDKYMNNSTEIINQWRVKYGKSKSNFWGQSVEQATEGKLYPDYPLYQSVNERPEGTEDELELIKDRYVINFPY